MYDTFILPLESPLTCLPIYFKKGIINIDKYWKSTNHDVAITASDQMKSIRAFVEGNYLTKKTLSGIQIWNNIIFLFIYGIGIQKFKIPNILSPFSKVPEMIGHCGSVSSVAFLYSGKTGVHYGNSKPNK